MSNETFILKDNMQKLLNINAKYEDALYHLNSIKLEKQELENDILRLLKSLNLENKNFKLNDNTIHQKNVTQYQALSMKYIVECLENEVEPRVLESIMNTIKNNRGKKIKQEIKIT